MQTGFSTNRSAEKLVDALVDVLPLTRGAAEEIVSKLIDLLAAAIPMQNHPGGMSDR